MLADADNMAAEPMTRREKRVLSSAVLLLAGYMIYLTMFSPSPKFYSFEEYARANAACGSDTSERCQIKELKAWRKANPYSPRGDSSTN